MKEWSKWKVTALIVGAGTAAGILATAGIYAYWKIEEPDSLRPPKTPQFASIPEHSSLVIDVPVKEYAYLGSFVFSTKTLDAQGDTVWSTQWVKYNPEVSYKFVAPAGLPPGMFSVVMAIDYPLNPITRVEDEVKFLDLIVNKEDK
jgi:hypothetical protein